MKRKIGKSRKVSSDVLNSENVKEMILKRFEEKGTSQNDEKMKKMKYHYLL